MKRKPVFFELSTEIFQARGAHVVHGEDVDMRVLLQALERAMCTVSCAVAQLIGETNQTERARCGQRVRRSGKDASSRMERCKPSRARTLVSTYELRPGGSCGVHR